MVRIISILKFEARALSCRVIQLEFASAADGFLYTSILPKAADGIGDIAGEIIGLQLYWKCKDRSPSGVVLGRELKVEGGHGFENGPHGLHRVGVDNLLVRLAFLFIIAAVVDEFHLLEDSRLEIHNTRLVYDICSKKPKALTLPDSPAPRSSILISLRACALQK